MKNKKILSPNKNFYFSKTGQLVRENIEKEFLLYYLYNSFYGKLIRILLRTKIAAKLYAFYQDSSLSKKNILPFIKKHKIDMAQFEKTADEYKSFNDFFIRKLKPDSRVINTDKNVLVSPADSKLFVIENLSHKTEFFVKNELFNLDSFLKNKDLAKEYNNGLMMIFRLAPYDYHRFHFPIDCFATNHKIIHGKYESVNPIAYKSGVQPLITNERYINILKTNNFSDIIFASIGAMFVGKIVYTHSSEAEHKKGEEMGYFEFGGSSLVLILKKDTIHPQKHFLENSRSGYETEVKMGDPIN